MNKTSIIILTYNNLDYTKACIESIRKYTEKNSYEIIVVDNNSTDDTKEWLLKQYDIKTILNDENLGFPRGCNQGIEKSLSNNDILLLNNDTVVTSNWLNNLKTCLYSNKNIGAVGAVSNHDENLQGVDFTYNDLDEMQKLAKRNNISNSDKWEEKNFLIGFCLLIKREVINKIGSLDCAYSPGYIEDNDLSLKIISLGYKLMLAHDSFIHHYLGTAFRKDLDEFYKVLYKNRKYFYNKWGFDTFSFDDIKDASIKILDNPKKVLDINSSIGTTILKIKYLFPDCIIEGVEPNTYKRKISSKFATIYNSLEEIGDNLYDFILIGNLLENVDNPTIIINKLKKFLNKGGYIIGEIENIASIENIKLLLEDTWFYKHNKNNYYTISDIIKMFRELGFNNEYVFSWYKKLDPEEKRIQAFLNEVSFEKLPITYYSFRFQKCE